MLRVLRVRLLRSSEIEFEPMRLAISHHPTLRIAAFATTYPASLGAITTPPAIQALLRLDAPAPLNRDEEVRTRVRDMLRHGGYKPTGRGKPASEYLVRAATEGTLSPINVAVDACNAVSLHSGFPISVVDLSRVEPPLHVAIAAPAARYVFNASGQEIDLEGLVCLFDAAGPCANAVRDAQRSKTSPETTRTISVIWGCAGYDARLRDAERWYRELLAQIGASTADVAVDAA